MQKHIPLSGIPKRWKAKYDSVSKLRGYCRIYIVVFLNYMGIVIFILCFRGFTNFLGQIIVEVLLYLHYRTSSEMFSKDFRFKKNAKQTIVVCPPQGFHKLCGSYHCRGFIVLTLSNLMSVTTIEDSETLQVISHHYRGFIIFTLSYFMDVSAIGVCKLAEQMQRWMGGQNGAPREIVSLKRSISLRSEL